MHPGDGRVVSNFIIQALKDEPITIYGEGQQTRSFCYVDDLIDALILFMNNKDDITGPMNLGNPEEFTILELAQAVVELTNSRSEMRFLPLPSDDPRQRQPDITYARESLGWAPKTALREGISRTIPYFQKLIEKGIEVNTWQPV